ncbi:efflux RND transporter periplasmic adaptor subunit [Tritonibacter scottomollicae]|uniref:Efflux RND transporter periplasmic adaptor subunit n=1 Tax=Tritonibacter scottomollicae TaxID=483013 RepID=A0A2T1A8Y2_TRISK|nr:efflux RND transporter periplasmic adaptor subunit [Tritonibacter scottomollicae]PRZ45041.1 multidrug efflux system membrane fusion protein [Tritonibacter scottomollicae]WOI34460.1 efflux RND transporter periplasmic adaptor subunit [Tritonibacter scottomollicae]
MRIIPPLTALVVTAGLYAVVMERDSLLAFARGEDTTEIEADAAEASDDQSQLAEAEDAGVRVAVVAVHSQARAIDNAVVLRGQTRAIREVNVMAETTSTVISEPLRKGASIKKDEVLCELDPGTRPASLLEARARLLEARAKMPEAEARLKEAHAVLEEARINLTAAQKLSEGGYASETRLASAKAAESTAQAAIASAEGGLESTRAGIESAVAAVASAEKEMDRLVLHAPFNGILESDTAEIGSLLQPGSLCATVIQLDTIKLVGYVPENAIDHVTLGSKAGARLAAGQEVTGTVSFISRSADEATRTFEVEITVPNPDLKIRDGQTAEIVIAAEGTKAHRLPQSALTLNNEGQLGVRVVRADSTAGFVPVRLLRDEAAGVWLDGLPEEADVIIVGQDFVTEGVALKPSYREMSE